MHCYESHTKALGDLRSRIFKVQGDVGVASCQYCCGLHTGGELTLDHYLPKNEFPEFSVLGENLVPCCAACNTRREGWLNQSGRRTTLNFYRDRLPAKALLVARLEREADIGWRAIFDYDRDDTSAVALLFQRHCEALHLLDRITLASRAELSSLQRRVRGWIRAGREATFVVSLLEEQAEADERVYGFNYWRAVLTRAVSKAGGFLSECYKSSEAA